MHQQRIDSDIKFPMHLENLPHHTPKISSILGTKIARRGNHVRKKEKGGGRVSPRQSNRNRIVPLSREKGMPRIVLKWLHPPSLHWLPQETRNNCIPEGTQSHEPLVFLCRRRSEITPGPQGPPYNKNPKRLAARYACERDYSEFLICVG